MSFSIALLSCDKTEQWSTHFFSTNFKSHRAVLCEWGIRPASLLYISGLYKEQLQRACIKFNCGQTSSSAIVAVLVWSVYMQTPALLLHV